jgi:hypothetical protein
MIVRIILPITRKDFAATRRRKREKARKITRYLLFDRSGGLVMARSFGVIFLTVTA